MKAINSKEEEEDNGFSKFMFKVCNGPMFYTFFSLKDLEERKSNTSLTFWQVLTLNAPEWKSIILGSLCSIIGGFSMPLIVVVFGDLFGVRLFLFDDEFDGKIK